MKRILPFLFAMAVVVAALGETVRIGTMDLPLCFEGEAPTGAVYDFATNEIVRYYHPAVGINQFSTTATKPLYVNATMKTAFVWRSPVFHDKIRFLVDTASTNCVVSMAFVTNAAAIYAEWNQRRPLVSEAEAFLDSITSGAVTNRPLSELRARLRTLSEDGARLLAASESDGTDEDVLASFAEMSAFADFEPPCMMEMSRLPLGTNTAWFLPVRTSFRDESGRSGEIAPIRLVYFDGFWSLLF